MTNNLKCPFCGEELTGHEDAYGNISDIWFDCPNEECEHAWTTFRFDVWQALIDGKKAQRQLRTVKDRCVKKVKAKEREIANYLNGINVRNKEIEILYKQLQKAQDALKEAIKCINWTVDTICKGLDREADIVGCCELSLERINEITKQENE